MSIIPKYNYKVGDLVTLSRYFPEQFETKPIGIVLSIQVSKSKYPTSMDILKVAEINNKNKYYYNNYMVLEIKWLAGRKVNTLSYYYNNDTIQPLYNSIDDITDNIKINEINEK